MKKSEIPTWLHQYTVADKKAYSVQHPAFTMKNPGEIELAEPVRNILEVAKVDPAEIISGILDMINTSDVPTNFAYENSNTPKNGFAKGMLLAAKPKNTYDVLSPWALIGWLLSLTPAQKAEAATTDQDPKWAQMIGFAITHPIVMKVIDNDEELFNAFGYISGGDYVWSMLINEERAARIPRHESHAQCLSWCVFHDLIKDLKGFPEFSIRALFAEDAKFVSLMSADQVKLCADMSIGSAPTSDKFLKAVQAETMDANDIKSLSAAQLAFIFMSKKKKLVEMFSQEQLTEVFMFLIQSGGVDDGMDYSRSHLADYVVREVLPAYTMSTFAHTRIGHLKMRNAISARLTKVEDLLAFLTENFDLYVDNLEVVNIHDSEMMKNPQITRILAEMTKEMRERHQSSSYKVVDVDRVPDVWAKRLLRVS